jgi:hypothetical protein
MTRSTTSQPRVRATCLTKAQLIAKLDHLDSKCGQVQRHYAILERLNDDLLKSQRDLYTRYEQLRIEYELVRNPSRPQVPHLEIGSWTDAVLRAKLSMFVQNPMLRIHATITIKNLLAEWVRRTNLVTTRRFTLLCAINKNVLYDRPKMLAVEDAWEYFTMRCEQEDARIAERQADEYFDSLHKD